jgi:hypothetical protein
LKSCWSGDHHHVVAAPAPILLIDVETDRSVADAIAGLTMAFADRGPLEGSINGRRISARLIDPNVLTRRKSWNVEFEGRIEESPNGARVRGTIDVPDRRQLHVIMWLFRVAAALVLVLAVGLAVRSLLAGQGIEILSIALGLAIAAGGWYATARLEGDGLQAATHDAETLAAALRGVFD